MLFNGRVVATRRPDKGKVEVERPQTALVSIPIGEFTVILNNGDGDKPSEPYHDTYDLTLPPTPDMLNPTSASFVHA